MCTHYFSETAVSVFSMRLDVPLIWILLHFGRLLEKWMGAICKVPEKWANITRPIYFSKRGLFVKWYLCFTCQKLLENHESSKRQEMVWFAGGSTYLVNCWLLADGGCGAHSFLNRHLSFSHSPQSCVELHYVKGAHCHSKSDYNSIQDQKCLREDYKSKRACRLKHP